LVDEKLSKRFACVIGELRKVEMVELTDELDRLAVGSSETKLDRGSVAERGRVAESVPFVDRSRSAVDKLSCTRGSPSVREALFDLIEYAIGEVARVFEVSEIVLAEIRSQPVKSKTLSVTKTASDLAKVDGDKPLENFIYLLLRKF
jgi:hypothetical protein